MAPVGIRHAAGAAGGGALLNGEHELVAVGEREHREQGADHRVPGGGVQAEPGEPAPARPPGDQHEEGGREDVGERGEVGGSGERGQRA